MLVDERTTGPKHSFSSQTYPRTEIVVVSRARSDIGLRTYKGAETKQSLESQVSTQNLKYMYGQEIEPLRLSSLIFSLSNSNLELESSDLHKSTNCKN